MTQFNYINSPAGAGKSYYAANEMLNHPAQYLVVRDRCEAIVEYASQLRRHASAGVEIISITNETVPVVRAAVRDIPDRASSHCIVLITHAAMMASDLSGFTGWDIWIDETPSIFDQQLFRTPLSGEWLADTYKLTPVEGAKGWSSVTMRDDAWRIAAADIARDDALAIFRTFHERVMSASSPPDDLPVRLAKNFHTSGRAVVCSITDWSEVEASEDDMSPAWDWWSVWSPVTLSHFNRIVFMANAFDTSLTFNMMQAFHDIEWNEIKINHRPYAKRKVVIEYFADKHVASRYLFQSEKGRDNLRKVAEHLSDADKIWMTNEAYLPALRGVGGQKLSPIQSGSNSYQDYHQAAAIYSAKPSSEILRVLEAIGLTGDHWTESVEYETILQFMTRTSVRDADSTETVVLSVYDSRQASYLARYFNALPHCDVTVQLTDLGFARDKTKPVGRPMINDTKMTMAERARRSRAKRTPEQIAAANEKRRAAYAAKKAGEPA